MQYKLKDDLDHILLHTEAIWEEFRGQRLFMTGGTGFFGRWLLESFVWANDKLELNAEAHILTRNLSAFQKKAPHLARHPSIHFYCGDVRSFVFPEGKFSHIIHAATEASASLNSENPLLMLDTIVDGTRRALEFARDCGVQKFLLTSSGAVYGRQPHDITHIPEDFNSAPDSQSPQSAYGEGKRLAELLCAIYSQEYGFETKVARCFAFVGPYMPIDTHFAIGNFIRDGLNGGPIQVSGDGTPYRSYLYAADLAIWLWTVLTRGVRCWPYNVGSDHEVTISDLAQTVAGCFQSSVQVHINKKPAQGQRPERYVPSILRAKADLGLRETIDLKESILRTIHWHEYLRCRL